jgi:hypothetical protein
VKSLQGLRYLSAHSITHYAAYQAFIDCPVKRAHDLMRGHCRIRAVREDNVHIVQPQPIKRRVSAFNHASSRDLPLTTFGQTAKGIRRTGLRESPVSFGLVRYPEKICVVTTISEAQVTRPLGRYVSREQPHRADGGRVLTFQSQTAHCRNTQPYQAC